MQTIYGTTVADNSAVELLCSTPTPKNIRAMRLEYFSRIRTLRTSYRALRTKHQEQLT